MGCKSRGEPNEPNSFIITGWLLSNKIVYVKEKLSDINWPELGEVGYHTCTNDSETKQIHDEFVWSSVRSMHAFSQIYVESIELRAMNPNASIFEPTLKSADFMSSCLVTFG